MTFQWTLDTKGLRVQNAPYITKQLKKPTMKKFKFEKIYLKTLACKFLTHSLPHITVNRSTYVPRSPQVAVSGSAKIIA